MSRRLPRGSWDPAKTRYNPTFAAQQGLACQLYGSRMSHLPIFCLPTQVQWNKLELRLDRCSGREQYRLEKKELQLTSNQ